MKPPMRTENHQACHQIYRHCLREFWIILGVWLLFFTWVIGYSLTHGFGPEERLKTIGGLPDWVFWGIAVPWGLANLATIVFCLFVMRDDPLIETDEAPLREPRASDTRLTGDG